MVYRVRVNISIAFFVGRLLLGDRACLHFTVCVGFWKGWTGSESGLGAHPQAEPGHEDMGLCRGDTAVRPVRPVFLVSRLYLPSC